MKRDVSYIENKSKMKDTNPTISVTALIMKRLNSRIKKQTMMTRCHDLRFLNVELLANFFTLLFHLHQEAF